MDTYAIGRIHRAAQNLEDLAKRQPPPSPAEVAQAAAAGLREIAHTLDDDRHKQEAAARSKGPIPH